MRNIRIGDYLVSKGLITEEQLIKVLQVQKESQGTKRFGEIIIELGMLSEVKFAQALASKLKVPFVDLSNMEIDEEAAKKIPEALAKKHTVIGINVQGKRLTVATDDPINFNILEDIKVSTGMDTIPVLATKTAINKAIGKTYQKQKVDSVIEDVAQHSVEEKVDEGAKERIESAPIVKLATTIVENGLRVNGDLIELMNVSNVVHNSLATRLKLISGMNIAEKRLPQDGRFTQGVDGVTLDVRVSSLPTVNGEKIVIRILSNGSISLRKITDLGMTDYNYGMFEKMLKCPHGVILVTGPTGSGKTTTLYAALGEIARPNVNVITVEDPVEKNIDGINQVQVNTKAGMTFAAALRSILRQDPDIVMIGEMRDTETAEIGIRAAITGHLVLSTLHTNDAASTITRLVDMGVPSYMVASSLIGVVAQRLVKVLCPKCKKPRLSTDEENELMGICSSVTIFDACGCSECNNTGYKGRTAIHEIIHCTNDISELIVDGANKDQLENAAKAHGTKLLRENVSMLVRSGSTTIDELVRVTYTI